MHPCGSGVEMGEGIGDGVNVNVGGWDVGVFVGRTMRVDETVGVIGATARVNVKQLIENNVMDRYKAIQPKRDVFISSILICTSAKG